MRIYLYSILIACCSLSFNTVAQVNCSNAAYDVTDAIVVSYDPTSTPTNHKVNFTATTNLGESTGTIFVWLKIPNSYSAAWDPTVVSGNINFAEKFTSNQFGDNFHWYSFTKSNMNPSSEFPVGVETIALEAQFPGDISPGDLEVVLVPPSFTSDGGSVFNGATYTYYRTTIAVCNQNRDALSMESLANILPIKLKSFSAAPYENRDAVLDWVTATEVNGSHFEIERSDDGVNFSQVGRVEASGNSNSDVVYSFSDRDVNMERNDVVFYYRLKMVDLDGEFKYSGVRVVNFTRSDIDFSINVYPNPTINFVQLNLSGVDNTSNERPMLNIYNTTGELIRSEVLNSDLGKIDMTNLPSSLYNFIIDYKGQRYTEKIVLIKYR